MAANPAVLQYLIAGARSRGINPDIAVKAFGHEALNVFDPTQPDRGGDEGSSFGPFQLHYGGMSKNMPNPGMGDDFTRTTGLDARDPSTWKAQTDFVLNRLASGGTWSPWMGAKAEGITGRMGLPGGSAVAMNAPAANPTSTSWLDTMQPRLAAQPSDDQQLASNVQPMPAQKSWMDYLMPLGDVNAAAQTDPWSRLFAGKNPFGDNPLQSAVYGAIRGMFA